MGRLRAALSVDNTVEEDQFQNARISSLANNLSSCGMLVTGCQPHNYGHSGRSVPEGAVRKSISKCHHSNSASDARFGILPPYSLKGFRQHHSRNFMKIIGVGALAHG